MFSTPSALSNFISALPVADEMSATQAQERQNQLTKPPTALGRLEELAIFMAGWRQTATPQITSAQALVFAGNHGVCAQQINPFPQEVTAQMVANFAHGGAAINQLAQLADATLDVHPIDLETPTADITVSPAMDEQELFDAIMLGADAVKSEADVIVLGEMGIGNSTISAALCAGSFGGESHQWVGRGTGADDDMLSRKAAVIDKAITRFTQETGITAQTKDGVDTGLEVLRHLGGREQAALCGAVLAARQNRQIVMLDGYICSSAVAPLHRMSPYLLDHCIVAHQSREPGHHRLLAALDKKPLFDLDLCLGEGSGAAIGLMLLRASLACHNGMASFAEAAISGSAD